MNIKDYKKANKIQRRVEKIAKMKDAISLQLRYNLEKEDVKYFLQAIDKRINDLEMQFSKI